LTIHSMMGQETWFPMTMKGFSQLMELSGGFLNSGSLTKRK